MPKTKRKTKSRRKIANKKVTANKTVERWLFTVAAILVIGAIIISIPLEEMARTMQKEQTNQPTQVTASYPCKTNTECFLISCRDTPSVVECVDSITTETYGTDACGGYAKVSVPFHDYTRCACVQNLCTLIK